MIDQPSPEEIAANLVLLQDHVWRLDNLYKIKDSAGEMIPFKMNWAQIDFASEMHTFNVVLKARQLGFTTFILLYMLDHALFQDNQSCGVIAQDLNQAEDIFENKVRFAYVNLPEYVRALVPLVSDNSKELKFKNGSSMVVGTSLRGGTMQKLLVSEFGKIAAKYPDKANEIKTGAFNTVHLGQEIFVESTAEGQAGEYYNLVKLARKLQDEGRKLSPMDPKFHFYPWYKNPNYKLGVADTHETVIVEEMEKYFRELHDEHGIELSIYQKAWYVKKADLMGEDMYREFPSTPDESFRTSVEGSIYGKQMRVIRKAGQITRVPWEPKALVHTFWDFGNANYMAIWFFQQVGREFRMIRYYQCAGQGFKEYADFMREQPYSYGKHYVPHDGDTTRLLELANKTYKQMMESVGITNIKVIPVTKSKWLDIENVCKPALLKMWFDEVHCADGIACLDNYRKVKNKDGVFLKEPYHDEFSDGADAFRTFAVGWQEPAPKKPVMSFSLEGQLDAPI